ncbi:endonuclease [Aureibacter tunicatorum]|nr:endonuclease [Aureibacter tunicatorum]
MFLCVVSFTAYSWGTTGHRVVGEIAQNHLSKKAEKSIKKILGDETLAEISNWMDFVKSDDSYDHTHCWHYVNLPDGVTYENSEKNPCGDIIKAIDDHVELLKSPSSTKEEKVFALKVLTHLVGDLHQPLHAGRKDDLGGNKVKVKWMYKSSNLHRVWDSGLIDLQGYSYTEYSNILNRIGKEDVVKLQNSTPLDWLNEGVALRDQIYDFEGEKLGYEYNYKNIGTVEERLLSGGVRLAGLLNSIFE